MMMSCLGVPDYKTVQDVQIREMYAQAMQLIIVPVVGANPFQPGLKAVCKVYALSG